MTATKDDTSILVWARKVQAIAQTGLAFTHDPYDRERYTQLQDLVATLLASELDIPLNRARAFWDQENGYATPKVDVRGAIFDGDKVLLVREIFEESGYHAKAIKLAALVDKNRHPHPPSVHHIYKLLFLCELTGGTATISNETDAVEFFPINALPELSTGRTLASQIARMYEHQLNRDLPTDFD